MVAESSIIDVPVDAQIGKIELQEFQEKSSLFTSAVTAFHVDFHGYLVEVEYRDAKELLAANPVWIDMVAPTEEDLKLVAEIFDANLPDCNSLEYMATKITSRFIIEPSNEILLYTDFMMGRQDSSLPVTVALMIENSILYSIRSKDTPAFMMHRLGIRNMASCATYNAVDILIDLYSCHTNLAGDTLHEVMTALEYMSDYVFKTEVSEEVTGSTLANIAQEEKLISRVRRNLMDASRSITCIIKSKLLTKSQIEESEQLLRDIDCMNNHTSFLLEKIKILLSVANGFVGMNQSTQIKKLTFITLALLPLILLAAIGGMSEFTSFATGQSSVNSSYFNFPWKYAYGVLVLAFAFIGFVITFSYKKLSS